MASICKKDIPGLSVQGVSFSKTAQEEKIKESVDDYVGSEDESDNNQYPVVEQLVDMNQKLGKCVETLMLRLEFDDKHHKTFQESVKLSAESEIRAKDSTINALKTELNNKESSLSALEEENEEKRTKMAQLQSQIDEMKESVELTASWLIETQKEIVNLESENRQLVSGETYENTQKEICALKKELYTFQQNVKVMSKDLQQARDVIMSQGNSIKILETEKLNMKTKFKEDLQQITKSLRFEIELMRDIMQKQWTEMKYLREQNQAVQQDVKDIRNLLSVAKLDSSRLDNEPKGFNSTSFPPSRRPTRGPPHQILPSVSSKRTVVRRK